MLMKVVRENQNSKLKAKILVEQRVAKSCVQYLRYISHYMESFKILLSCKKCNRIQPGYCQVMVEIW